LEGVPYITGTALENLAKVMHNNSTFRDITVKVTYSTGAPIQGATVNLLKMVNGVAQQINSGQTDASGSMVFTNLTMNKKYKVVVIKSNVDFNGAVTGMQSKVKFGNTVPVTPAVKLASNTTINVQQGTPATNGPVGKEWKGDNGSRPTITITTP
jgi:5-hydroxyisourate hydrolase-like protein (transthyretin family)